MTVTQKLIVSGFRMSSSGFIKAFIKRHQAYIYLDFNIHLLLCFVINLWTVQDSTVPHSNQIRSFFCIKIKLLPMAKARCIAK